MMELAVVRAPASPAQPLGGGIGRGAEPPSEATMIAGELDR
jgi:hypothetical protein